MKMKAKSVLGTKWSAIMAAAIVAFLALPALAETRIATVDLKKVFETYYKTRLANDKLNERLADLEKEQKTLVDQYQKAKDDYKRALDDANDQALSIDEREKRKKAAETKLLDVQSLQQTIDDFNKTARTSVMEQHRNVRDRIMGEIKTVVSAKAKAGTFSLVFDTAAETTSGVPNILYSNGENDITSIVVEELNRGAPATLPDKKDAKK
jgi:outer membrane protein